MVGIRRRAVNCVVCGRFMKRCFAGTDLELRCGREWYDAVRREWRHE